MNGNTHNNKSKRGNGSTVGLLLIGLGALLLLSNLGIIGGFGNLVGLGILGAMGGFLLHQHYTGRGQMWLLIAGFTLLGCAAATVTGEYAGAWFLGITGIGFLQVWRERAKEWWALLPAGTLFTLAGVVVAETGRGLLGLPGGTVLFAGLAITFMIIYMLPNHAQSWAIIPAVGSAGLALLIWGSSGSWFLPLILIAVGLYLISGSGKIPRSFNYGGTTYRNGNGRRSKPAEPTVEDEPRNVAQLPEEIGSTGPEIPERWTEPDASAGDAPRNG